MKTGILTLPLHINYGGILQAYALQTVLENLGHEAELILRDLPPGAMPWQKGLSLDEQRTILQHTHRFIHQYIKGEKNSLSKLTPADYEAIVVGSDQIWRYYYTRHMPGGYGTVFLGFTEGWPLRRISYAASFGVDEWEAPADVTPDISRLLHNFNAVSVRESSGVTLCHDVLGVEAQHVVDPTMLLTSADYKQLIDSCNDTRAAEGELMCYILDETPDKTALIDTVAKRFGLRPFRANAKAEQPGAPLSERVQAPVEQWLRSFRDARMVITDSFHATVFSILFGKPFIVTGNPGRGLARLESLLDQFGMADHLVLDAADFNAYSDYSQPASVPSLLSEKRQQSLEFLKKAFS